MVTVAYCVLREQIMAGSGHLQTFRLLRFLRSRNSADGHANYGIQMAVSSCLVFIRSHIVSRIAHLHCFYHIMRCQTTNGFVMGFSFIFLEKWGKTCKPLWIQKFFWMCCMNFNMINQKMCYKKKVSIKLNWLFDPGQWIMQFIKWKVRCFPLFQPRV